MRAAQKVAPFRERRKTGRSATDCATMAAQALAITRLEKGSAIPNRRFCARNAASQAPRGGKPAGLVQVHPPLIFSRGIFGQHGIGVCDSSGGSSAPDPPPRIMRLHRSLADLPPVVSVGSLRCACAFPMGLDDSEDRRDSRGLLWAILLILSGAGTILVLGVVGRAILLPRVPTVVVPCLRGTASSPARDRVRWWP